MNKLEEKLLSAYCETSNILPECVLGWTNAKASGGQQGP